MASMAISAGLFFGGAICPARMSDCSPPGSRALLAAAGEQQDIRPFFA
jgi:hypothetical protein